MKVSPDLMRLAEPGVPVSFHKLYVLGQTVLVVDQRPADAVPLTTELCERLADAKLGVGFDQLVTIHTSRAGTHATLRFWHRNGAEVGVLDNGVRCAAEVLLREGDLSTVQLCTRAGIFCCGRTASGGVWMDVGEPIFQWQAFPFQRNPATGGSKQSPAYIVSLDVLFRGIAEPAADAFPKLRPAQSARAERRTWYVGTPLCILLVDRFGIVQREDIREMILRDVFFSSGSPAWRAKILRPQTIRMKHWPHGSHAEQRACGSVAAAALASTAKFDATAREVDVEFERGTVQAEWPEPTADRRTKVRVSGPVSFVFSGQLAEVRAKANIEVESLVANVG